ncbi:MULTISPECIES: acetyl/propionyl/methylcrotonyl-CoA carboxylase subunit alpha [unclassified Arthrobacter]|uniref:acetyl/propionyl/methylcrotonyl-CoA carboxylase subunit alpha n=1 Tax=unclassified Arthrobacter TaxID=235627 RepID=UPI0014919C5A|nr:MULTISPECIES: acetyl-CoA carboxylase biotin carboxylase subunit [unclassified Arthrobacter]MBE0009295.1 acetyl-CoA carboxylase biotin carboxylase subunit [Arthrobacter sp. AET 35A]NOJ63130.1 acetyl-CoA carboxylase biotin carboxylase subunit [Arthrobacter sp. 147(2020)]
MLPIDPTTDSTALKTALFETVLVANRGEIACRVLRSLRALGIRSVAVYSDADADALHVREADVAVRIGPAAPAQSYLSIDAIVDACRRTGAQAVHPGYGFLSENQAFAQTLSDAGIAFIGPSVHALNVMGDKIRSKNHVMDHGVPVVPGIAQPDLTDQQLLDAAADVGFPLLIKPSAGGGGKGMHVVERHEDLAATLPTARRVAASAFGDDTLFMERLILTPRHIEVQVLADNHGNVIHLGERECSLQRRHQKVIEEAPSPLLDEATRIRIGEAACNAARSVDYSGAGTVEFLVSADAPDEFFFMEMNTRLQVEHPVTEMITGIDLVQWQVRIAAGEKLTLSQEDVVLTGHAVEARVYAEDPEADFLPSTGTVVGLAEPRGEGIRVDSSLLRGLDVSASYDPMLSKVIAWGRNRTEALDRLDRALADTVVLGVHTNIEYLKLLINDVDVRAGRLDTTMIERKLPGLAFRRISDEEIAILAAVDAGGGDGGADGSRDGSVPSPWARRDGWRIGAHRPRRLNLAVSSDDVREVLIEPGRGGFEVRIGDAASRLVTHDPEQGTVTVDGIRRSASIERGAGRIWYSDAGWSTSVRSLSRAERLEAQLALIARAEGTADPEVRSTMPGTVTSVAVADGDTVDKGQTLLSVEAMKMEHQLTASVAGTVSIHLKPGDLVKANQIVARIHATETLPDPAGIISTKEEA